MARTQEVTAYYIRTGEGDTFYVDTLDEALRELISEDGYRLTLISASYELVIRRTSEWLPGIISEQVGTADLTFTQPVESRKSYSDSFWPDQK